MADDNDNEVPFYETTEWADVVPVPQDDGPNPLVPIAYAQEYSKAMDYFRAICRTEEQSERALELTKIVIELNSSHYTVWYYRQKLLKVLNKDLAEEMEWIQDMVIEHPKSYQIWRHRQVVVEYLSEQFLPSPPPALSTPTSATTPTPTIQYQDLPSNQQEKIREMVQVELSCLKVALEGDSKNYHAWSYRQWVMTHFGPGPWWEEELGYVDELLSVDIRNNSAWNQRFFAITEGPRGLTEELLKAEVEYTKTKIQRTPNNESPWVYLSGILNRGKHPVTEIKDFCESLLPVIRANCSPFLHSTLLDIYELEAKEEHNPESLEKAKEEASTLAEKVDTIRSKYWNWRKTQLKSISVDA